MNEKKISALILFIGWITCLCLFIIGDQILKNFSLIMFTGLVIYYTVDAYRKSEHIKRIETLNKQISYINNLTEVLRGTTKLEEVLTLILRNLIDGLKFNRALIFIVTSDHKQMIKYCAGYTKEGKITGFTYTTVLDKEKSILARSIIEKQAYIITDAPNNYYCEQSLVTSLNLKEFGLVPIIVKNDCVGVILVDNYKDNTKIEEDTMEALKVYANQSGLAIEDAKMHEKIENLAIKDGLTDIYNHRYFQETLIKEFEKSVKDNSNLSLIFIDIDNFKQYNDTYGHAEGDRLLQNITKLINNNLDEIATFARYGGEEFVILLPGINKKEAFITAEKIRKLVEEHTFSSADNTINQKITISLGVSNYPEDVKRPESLTDIADKGLYLAKKSGKNKVCIYT